jgi:hypothetical protein
MRLEDIINDQFIKEKIENHINDLINCDETCKISRFEYPIDSGNEWKIICNQPSDNEIIIKIKKRK